MNTSRIHQPSKARNLISLTPLIDVVFILLVFFMLATSYLDWRLIDLVVPVSNKTERAPDGLVTVTLRDDGSMSINGAATPAEQLGPAVTRKLEGKPNSQVIVLVEAGVPVQRAVATLDRLTVAGVPNLSLSRMSRP